MPKSILVPETENRSRSSGKGKEGQGSALAYDSLGVVSLAYDSLGESINIHERGPRK